MSVAKKSVFVVAGLALAVTAHAQYSTGFEQPTFIGSALGTALSPAGSAVPPGLPNLGQGGWYNPNATGIAQNVYTYTGNALGLAPNPTGGDQFIGMTSGGGSLFPRGQISHASFSADVWTVAYDFAANWRGTGASAPNLSSFSIAHDTIAAGSFRQFIALNNFMDLNNPALGWKAEYNIFSAAGAALNNQSPGAAWTNLINTHWYRQSTTFSLATNQILSVEIADLSVGGSTSANPVGWFMTGGSASTLALPNAVRFFEGGAAGNTMGWDNLNIVPAPGTLALLGLGGLVTARRRR